VRYILDACALMAHLNEESEAPRVRKLFDEATAGISETTGIHMSSVAEADRIMSSVSDLPIHVIDTITDTVYSEASRLKAVYSISLADAFACATAENLSVLWIK
jgi:predicted nucleic acid-binding protein